MQRLNNSKLHVVDEWLPNRKLAGNGARGDENASEFGRTLTSHKRTSGPE